MRRRAIAAELRRLGLDDPNPHDDLWAWYGYYSESFSAGSGGGYIARRNYVRELYKPLLDALDHLEERTLGAGIADEPTGWDRVDSQVRQLRERYATARTVEDFQAVGLLCRDIFVSLADAAFDAEVHLPDGEEEPTSAKERLKLVVAAEAAGGSNEKLRKALNAVLDLANTVQHDRAATLGEAAIVAESTVASVNIVKFLVRGAEVIAEATEDDDDFGFLDGQQDDPRDEDWYRD